MRNAKKKRMRKQMDQAQREKRIALKRMREMDGEIRRANAISDGSQIFVTILASLIGESFHVEKEQIEKAKRMTYMVRRNADGSLDMALEQLLCESGNSAREG